MDILRKINVIVLLLLLCNVNRDLTDLSQHQSLHLKYSYSTPKINPSITLKIDKINLQVTTDMNVTLEQGLEIHPISYEKNTALVISGHSGIGNNVYFNDLFKLAVGDEINIYKDNYKYVYYLEQIISFAKGSKLQINKEKEFLYLVTCDLYNMQKQWIFSSKLAKIEEI